MSLTKDHYVTFWANFARDLSNGVPLVEALDQSADQLEGSALGLAVRALRRKVQSGSTLSEAMSEMDDIFSPSMSTMTRAGEAGGVLDIIASRVCSGIECGCLCPPGCCSTASSSIASLFRALGVMLSSGVPVLTAIELLETETTDNELLKMLRDIRQAMENGERLSSACSCHPDLCSEELCRNLAAAEEEHSLDECCLRLAESLDGVAFSLAQMPTESIADAKPPADPEPPLNEASDWANAMLNDAISRRASDIHLDPTEDGVGRIRFRIDGVLNPIETPSEGIFAKAIVQLKMMSKLDIAEKRMPQFGRATVAIEGQTLDLHMSTVLTAWGERLVIRIINRQSLVFDLDRMGFMGGDLETARSLCQLPSGLVICSGPTGSGKTTVLYSMLHEIDREKNCVMSIEDPVEIILDGVAQIAVKPRLGVNFPRAIVSALRQDPDVLCVGEIRDFETLQLVVNATLTGHLVFTSLHADTCASAVQRLLDIGLEPFLVNASLAGVISQRLIRVLCSDCKKEHQPQKDVLPPVVIEFLEAHTNTTFFEPVGCDSCRGSGYRGRTTAYEILQPSSGFKKAVSEKAGGAALAEAAAKDGLKPMIQIGLEKAAQGITSIDEVVRVLHLAWP